MLQDAHTRKISQPINIAPVGNTIIIAAKTDAWIYIHELIGDLSSAGTLSIYAGTTELANFALADGQGITEQDEPGEDNRPRFECKPGESFNITCTGGNFIGAVHYSYRY